MKTKINYIKGTVINLNYIRKSGHGKRPDPLFLVVWIIILIAPPGKKDSKIRKPSIIVVPTQTIER